MFHRNSSKRTGRSRRARGAPLGRRRVGLRLEPLEPRRLLTGSNSEVANLLAAPTVVLETNHGDITLELLATQAPGTVDNFLNYANDGDYDNSFFHRLVSGFVIQGGGFTTSQDSFFSTGQFSAVPTDPPITNEFGISNTRATVAMAKLGGDPDSATSQFFVNLTDNSSNLDNQNGGFTVFATISDMSTVDAMAATPTYYLGGSFSSLPIDSSGDLLVVHSVSGNGEIRGTVFEDFDQDGVQGDGEYGISDITVFVDANDNGTLDENELTTTSSTDGSYVLQVPSGDYVIRPLLTTEAGMSFGEGRLEVNVEMGRYTENVDFGQILVPENPENPENLTVIDDADEGFSQFGFEFISEPSMPGYQVGWFRKQVGTGDGEASWTFTNLEPGQYRVSKTWRESGTIMRANDAPFTIENGAGEILSEVMLNQQWAPDDFTFDGVNWEDLDVVTVTDGTLIVTLSGSPAETGLVVADAVGIAPEQILTLTVETDTVGESDGAQATTGTVIYSKDTTEDLLVHLVSDDPSAVEIPASVIIPAGYSSVTFDIGTVDNGLLFDSKTVSIAASANRTTGGTVSLQVVNDDLPVIDPDMTVTLHNDIGELQSPPYFSLDAMVTHKVAVANFGNLSLESVYVIDDNETPNDPNDDTYAPAVLMDDFNTGDIDQNNKLDPGESWLFSMTRVAGAGEHVSGFSLAAFEPLTEISVSDVVSSTYFGVASNVALAESSTGYSFDEQGRTLFASGDLIVVSYLVSNSGNMALSGVEVLSDSVAATAVLDGSTNVGDVNQDGLLDTSEVWEFTASHVVATGAYTSASSVSATDSGLGLPVADAVSATYFGVAPNVALAASSTGYGFDDEGRMLFASGESIVTSYLVSNAGNMALSGVEVLSDSVAATAVLDGST
ncbi:MAG: peptidylprolyl isomerase, partial [Pirellulales bacterium]|nr:peptidylprolyl isomerase [Pirellulales bacterium]